jgi:hypothetical protein
MAATAATATTGATCAWCGSGDFGQPVTATARAVVFAYCSAACREEHLVAVELAAVRCAAPGCDRDAVGDLPVCAAHLAA